MDVASFEYSGRADYFLKGGDDIVAERIHRKGQKLNNQKNPAFKIDEAFDDQSGQKIGFREQQAVRIAFAVKKRTGFGRGSNTRGEKGAVNLFVFIPVNSLTVMPNG